MRIIGGEFRSRSIAMPKGVLIRPTQDKVRQAIFNILGDVSGKRVLDLFAGSGAFGLESLSRGAVFATMVDDHPACIKTIQENADSLRLNSDYYNIIRHNAIDISGAMPIGEIAYDLVFMDPPYGKGLAKKCLINMDSCDILSRNALIVVETRYSDPMPEHLDTMELLRQRKYGDTAITLFRKIR